MLQPVPLKIGLLGETFPCLHVPTHFDVLFRTEQSANFWRQVLERDPHGLVTGTRNSRLIGLEASHMFPLAWNWYAWGR